MEALRGEELRAWLRYIHEISGIYLDESKGYLVENRLTALRDAEGCANLSELYFRVRAERGGALRRKVIDAITTRETFFFRDQAPFELLRHKLLPDLIDRRVRAGVATLDSGLPIRVWSAACSTGQELYSIAMIVSDLLHDWTSHRIRLIGTDISDDAIARASYGAFSTLEVERGLTPTQRDRYLVRHAGGWRVRDELRAMVSFRSLNLHDDFSALGRFDIVLCRNVAIYFREEYRPQLFRRIAGNIDRGGALLVGAMEAVANTCPAYEPKRYHRTVYYELRNSF